MHWLFGARRLRALGILGMNRRNAECILDHNPRSAFPMVDSKLRMHDLCVQIGVQVPAIHARVTQLSQLRWLETRLADHRDFVLKPNHGSAGRGILVLVDRQGSDWLRHDGSRVSPEALRQAIGDILSGMYSLGGRPDQALVQQRIRLHPRFEPIAVQGIPDLRVILYRGEPAMAMLRLPTKASGGRANLHQGGIGAGIALETGVTHHAVQYNRLVKEHPDTGASLIDFAVPRWQDALEMSRRVARSLRLGYLGVDIVIDAAQGPMLLEANARPGLAIQIANAAGLEHRLRAIDAQCEAAPAVEPAVMTADPARAEPSAA